MGARDPVPTVQMRGPAGVIVVNESDVEEYKKQKYKLLKKKEAPELVEVEDEEVEEEEEETEEEEEEEEESLEDLIGSMSGPQLVEFVEEQELDVEFAGNDKVGDKRQKVLDALAARDDG